jgi:NTE family protein
MRVGLVLGAGGVVGGSWLVGALEALESETGWSPSSADVIVGTSAGSVVGALTASGLSPALMSAYIGGGQLDELAEMEDRTEELEKRMLDHVPGSEVTYQLQKALPPIGPGSWRMALSTLLRPTRHAPSALLSAWLPRGFVSTKPISSLVERFVEDDWVDHPNFWPVVAYYGNGKRVALGRDGSPPARVGDAVAASCAIPGFYHPVKISGRRYVDGGICSASNLDLLCDEGLDLVVCLNPMSSLAEITPRSAGDRVAGAMRKMTGRRLGHEAKKLRAAGTDVLILQPTAEDLVVMGPNLMARDRRGEVIERAVRTTARQHRRRRGREGVDFPKRQKGAAAARRAKRAATRAAKAA